MKLEKTLQALELVTYLAEGINPLTGEWLPEGHLCQRPELIRAFHRAVGALQQESRRERKALQRPVNAGLSWTEQEDSELGTAFDEGVPLDELAQRHGRSQGAVEARLVKLGKLELNPA